MFGGTAAAEFVRLNADLSDELLVATTVLVLTEALVLSDDFYV
jgi:hypothetical protein